MRRTIAHALMLLSIAGCNETLVKGQGNRPGAIISVSSISFEDVNREIFQARCTGCHGGAGGVNLQGYENVKANAIRSQIAIESGRMPPGSPLSLEAKGLLSLWISKGMPLEAVPVDTSTGDGGNNQGDPPPPVDDDDDGTDDDDNLQIEEV